MTKCRFWNNLFDMDNFNMLRIKTEEIARYRVLRGFKTLTSLAEALGWHRQYLSQVLNMPDPGGVHLKTIARMCKVLSAPDDQVKIEDLVEYVPDS